MLSSTVITCTQVVVLPQASVANQVLVIVEALGQEPALTISLKVITGALSQLSVAVATPPVQ